MSDSVARLTAAAFCAVGVDGAATPDSDDETLDLGGLYSSGEECLPHKVTLGDFLRVCRQPGFDPEKVAFFMPMAHGPCRFGQYAPYLRQKLNELGYGDVMVVSPTTKDSYQSIGEHAGQLKKTVWMAIVLGDLATRFRLKTRPYELNAGDADAAFDYALEQFGETLALPELSTRERLGQLARKVALVRDRFRAIPAMYEKGRPLIGLVGEIFCRQNTFTNEDTARRVERLGGECWLSDISEWIWYTNWWRQFDEVRCRGYFNLTLLKHKITQAFQRHYEHVLLKPVDGDFKGYEEPHDVREVLAGSQRYLPATGALGEMTLSVGKAVY
ncbi:MAG: hypothetical protein JXO22_00645, partial [Phycisphaerae bacterium]|nr:hypothetical protein [Phycisphaerae bacterium]